MDTRSGSSPLAPNDPNEQRVARVYTLLVVIYMTCMLVWVVYRVKTSLPRVVPSESFCCPEIARQLLIQSNRSIDPCANFLDYTCYGVKKRGLFLEFSDIIRQQIVYPVLSGTSRNPVARAIHSYYTGCIVTVVTEENLCEKALAAVADVCGFRGTLEPQQIVKKVVELEEVYRVTTVMTIEVMARRGEHILSLDVVSLREAAFTKYWSKAFLALGSRLFLNVSIEQTWDFALKLIQVSNRRSISAFGNFSIFRNITPRLPLTEWQLILARVDDWSDSLQVTVENAETVRDVLDILTEPESSALATAFVLMASTISLAKEAIIAQTYAKNHQRLFTFCSFQTNGHYYLWEAAAASLFTNKTRDIAVRNLFFMVFDAVNRTVVRAVGQCCTSRATTLLSTFRLALPSDVNFLTPPKMTEYWKNELALRHYDRRVLRGKRRKGIPLHWDGIERFHLDYTDRVIYVPPGAYALLHFTEGVEPFINAATIGVEMADTLWWNLFRRNVLNASVVQRLTAKDDALYGNAICNLTRLHYPWLALSTVSEAVRTLTWHNVLPVLSSWQASSSQTFYMLFFSYHMCPTVSRAHSLNMDNIRGMAVRYITALPDFNLAFRCTEQPTIKNSSCVLCQ